MGVDVGPLVRRRLALVIPSRPRETARHEASGEDARPCHLSRLTPTRVLRVVPCHMAAHRIILVLATVAVRAGSLGADGWDRGGALVPVVVASCGVVEALEVEDGLRAVHVVIVGGDGSVAKRIPLVDHALGDQAIGRLVVRLAEHLVAQRPDHNRWVVAAAEEARERIDRIEATISNRDAREYPGVCSRGAE